MQYNLAEAPGRLMGPQGACPMCLEGTVPSTSTVNSKRICVCTNAHNALRNQATFTRPSGGSQNVASLSRPSALSTRSSLCLRQAHTQGTIQLVDDCPIGDGLARLVLVDHRARGGGLKQLSQAQLATAINEKGSVI